MKEISSLFLARNLRRNQTEAENRLWYYLRNRRLNGIKFRRQQRIGQYIADFVSYECKLIVEVDGGQHNEESERARDAERTAWLEEHGFRVLRFWNSEVLKDTDMVLTAILNALNQEGMKDARQGQ